MNKTRVISLVTIPCFNTGSSIHDVVSKSQKYVSQVVVIDDGSTDDTVAKASAAGAQVISHSKNLGYGTAVRSCIKAAIQSKADILIIIDGDGQHCPDDIPRLIDPIASDEADITIGSRFLDGDIRVPGYRRLGISIITHLFNLGARDKITDSQSGFRGYHRRLFSKFDVTEKGMSVSIEILEASRRNHARIKEVPIICYYPPKTFNMKAVWHGLGVALAVIKIRFLGRFKTGGKMEPLEAAK